MAVAGTVMTGDAINRLVIENLNTALLLFDGQLRLRYVNPAGEMLLGISARRVLDMTASELLPGEAAIQQYLNKVQETGRLYTEREQQLSLPDGKEITVDCTVTPVIGIDGEEAVLVELLRVDRMLRISRDESLLAQNQATRAVVRGMAHEIKNPLGGLRGAAQLLERELMDETLKEYTRIIIGEADRLRNLVNKMLGPNSILHKTEINIHEVLERVRSLVLAEAGNGVTIERNYDPSIPLMKADMDQMIQAVLNIVRNAIHAIGGDGEIILCTRVERQFTIGTERYSLVARIEITDNGTGIPAEMLENIFYPMVTGHAEGTGLGLSIAQSIINQHNGLIECRSKPGKTTFTLLLPLETDDEHQG